MMKKLAILLTLMMAVVLLFAACGENKTPAHEHDYGTLIAEVPATCTTAGTKAHYHCSGCNKDFDSNKNEITDLVIPATGHTEVTDEAVAATCTEAGKTAGKHCSVCGEVITAQDVVPATGHTEVIDEAVAATCTEAGKTAGKHCSVCGEVITAQEVVPATGHTESDWIVDKEATCTEAGGRHKECTVCGETTATEVISATGHTETDWIVDKEATCTEAGGRHKECTVCGETTATEVLPASHTFGEWVEGTPATCTTDGTKGYYHCSVCEKNFDAEGNEIDDFTIPAFGHTGEWVIDMEATCTEAGKKHQVCSVCGEVLIAEEVIPARHTFGEWVEGIAATCEEDGITGHFHCSVCEKDFDADGNEIIDFVVPATGHKLGGWIAAVPKSEGKDGIVGHRTCENCGKNFDMRGKEIERLIEHDFEVLGGGYRTITEDGVSPMSDATVQKHLRCKNCDKLFNLDYEEISEEDLKIETRIAISSNEEMQYFADQINAGNSFAGETFMLLADVELNTTIGATSAYPFSGSFDGLGHTITINQTLTNPDGLGGLFSFVRVPEGGAVTIQNVHLVGTITMTNNTTGKGYVGALVSAVDAGKVSEGEGGTFNVINVWNSVRINAGAANAWNSLGGMIGFVRHEDGVNPLTINMESCLWDGTINAGPALYSSGGFIGSTGNNKPGRTLVINISNSVAAGQIMMNQDWNVECGILIGYAKGSYSEEESAKVTLNITNVVSFGKITNSKNHGSGSKIGHIGQINGTTALNMIAFYYTEFNCKNLGNAPALASGEATLTYNVKPITLAQVLTLDDSYFTVADQWVFAGGINYPCPKGIVDTFGQPDSMKADPYDIYDEFEIGTDEAMEAFAAAVNSGKTYEGKTIKLTADVNLTTAIGETSSKYFSGNFDGQGHTVTITQTFTNPEGVGGLFSMVRVPADSTVTIQNVHVTGLITLTNNAGSKGYVGALISTVDAGTSGNGGTLNVTNVWSTTRINAGTANTWYAISGMIGFVRHASGLKPITINIDSCLWDGVINAGPALEYSGSFIGYAGNQGNANRPLNLNITNSVVAGTIMLNTAWTDDSGLLTGYLKGNGNNNSTSNVTANFHDIIITGRITSSASLTKWCSLYQLSGTTTVDMNNFYYVSFNVSGKGAIPVYEGSATPTGTATAKTTSEILALTAGDFSNADKWVFAGGVNYPCPKGIYDVFGQPESMTVSPYDVYDEIEIGTKKEFLAFRDAVNNGNAMAGKTITLTADIDLAGEDWTAIGVPGGTGSVGKAFHGTFDGDGHTISNLTTLLQPTSGNVDMKGGLFASLGDGAVVKNFYLTGTITIRNYSAGSGTDYFGSVANAVGGTVLIQNVHSSVNFNTSNHQNPDSGSWAGAVRNVGGLVGFIFHRTNTDLTIDGCTYSGTINPGNSAENYAGIIAYTGSNESSGEQKSSKTVTITNSAFTGRMTINGSEAYLMQGIAGIIGKVTKYTTVNITGTHSDGKIYFNSAKDWPIVDGDSNPIKIGQILGYNEDGSTVNIGNTVTYIAAKLQQDHADEESIYILPEAGRLNGIYAVDTDAVEIIEEEVEEVE